MAVVEVSCRYRKPSMYDDELVIVTGLDHMSSRAASFSYHVYREETLLAEGKTVHVFINKEGRPADVRRYAIWPLLQPILEMQKMA